jgi:hypothetical protein
MNFKNMHMLQGHTFMFKWLHRLLNLHKTNFPVNNWKQASFIYEKNVYAFQF